MCHLDATGNKTIFFQLKSTVTFWNKWCKHLKQPSYLSFSTPLSCMGKRCMRRGKGNWFGSGWRIQLKEDKMALCSDLEGDYREYALFFWSAKQKDKNYCTQTAATKTFTTNREKKFFTGRVDKWRSSCPRRTVKSPSLEIFKIQLVKTLCNLIFKQWVGPDHLQRSLPNQIILFLHLFYYLILAATQQSTELTSVNP